MPEQSPNELRTIVIDGGNDDVTRPVEIHLFKPPSAGETEGNERPATISRDALREALCAALSHSLTSPQWSDDMRHDAFAAAEHLAEVFALKEDTDDTVQLNFDRAG